LIKKSDLLENISKLYVYALTLPISNAEVERVVSSFSFIKNKLRNRLLVSTADELLFVYKKSISK